MNTASTGYGDTGERTADECDFASNIAMAETATHLKKKQQEIANIVLDPDFDGVHCVECGQKIPKLRIDTLRMNVPTGRRACITSHPTDRHYEKDGETFVDKHGTDKCVICQSEANHIQAVRRRQHAY